MLFRSKHAFPKGEASNVIEIELSAEGEDIIICVSDNGVGLPEDFAFDRVESVGLSIIKSMVDSFRGKIQFASDNGTRVRISVPRPMIMPTVMEELT